MRWWMGFVAGVGGVSAGRAVTETLEQRVREATQGVLTATSDAYSEPGGQGLGVYMHGLYTWYDVPRHLQGLHITALEFLAGLLTVKTCSGVVEAAVGRIRPTHEAGCDHRLLCTDREVGKEQDASSSASGLTANAGVHRDKTLGCDLAHRWAQQHFRGHGEQTGEEASHVQTGSSDGSRAH